MNYRNSQISESEESDEEAQTSKTKNVNMNRDESSSSDTSSDSEDSRRPPPPPKHVPAPSTTKKINSNPLEKFLAANRSLNKIVVNDVVTEDDDVCLLEVPSTVDPAHLMGELINFDRRTKMKLDGTKYVIKPAVEDIKPINLLTKKIRVIDPISVLRMHDHKKQRHESASVKTEVSPLFLSDELKDRHPLFGLEYKRKVVLSEDLQRQLEAAIDKTVHKMKKKKDKEVEDVTSFQTPMVPSGSGKKKKKKKEVNSFKEEIEGEDTETQLGGEESIFAMLENHIAHKKNVKENTMTSEAAEYEHQEEMNGTIREQLESSTPGKKKIRRKRKHHVKEETVEEKHGDRSRLQNSFKGELIESKNNISNFQSHSFEAEDKTRHKTNSLKEEVKSKHQESFNDNDFSFNESKLKKKKKHNLSVKEERVSPSALDRLNFSTPIDSTNRMRRNSIMQDTNNPKRLSIANSTVLPGFTLPCFESDISHITNKDDVTRNEDEQEHHKKKHKKEKSFDKIQEENTESLDFKEEHQKKKKKSKKDKSFELDGEVKRKRIKEECVTAGESCSDRESSPKKRKKKKHDAEEEEEAPVPEKRKVKVKEEKRETDPATSSLISNLMSRIKNEMDSPVNHHRKRSKSEK